MASPHDPTLIFRHFLYTQPRWWSRRRGSLGPPHVVLSLISMSVLGCRSYERTLDEMKQRLGTELGWIRKRDVPSPSALSQARLKLDSTMCASIVSQVYAMCSTARTCASLGYGGFRLLALDGTKLTLPAYTALRDHFGCPSQGEGRELAGPQASLTVLWDVGANQPVNWRLGPYKVSERVHADELIGGVGPGDLVLGDRGFPSRRLLTHLWSQQAQVLVRMRTTGTGVMREVTAFLSSGATDLVTTMHAWDEHAEEADPTVSMPIRLIRTVLPDGSSTVYLTTLTDVGRHPSAVLLALYAQRWRIETAFREMKIWHGLERFHSRRVDGIAQEVAAIMIFQLLASELEAKARLVHQRPLPSAPAEGTAPLVVQRDSVRFNRRIVADCVCDLIFTAACGKDLADAFAYAMFRIWRYRQTVKPGRSFPRQRKSAPRGWKPRGTKGKGYP
jgi:hypothetical protein